MGRMAANGRWTKMKRYLGALSIAAPLPRTSWHVARHIDAGRRDIDRRVVAVRPGIMQPHPAATTATNSNPLQQRIAPPRHPLAVCIIAIEIVREPLLVRHELLPIDISRKCVLQTNWPILYRHGFRRA